MERSSTPSPSHRATGFDEMVQRFRATQLSRRRLLRDAAVAGGGAALAATLGRAPRSAYAADAGQTAIFVSAVDIPNIDPAVGHDEAIATTQKTTYDTLYRHLGNPVQLVPWLATGHTASADAKEWTFTLDPKAKFQDGSPVTADAVVYSLQRLLKINQGVAWMFNGVMDASGVQAVDPHTVKFTLTKSYAPFLHATAWLFVLNPAVVKQHEKDGDMGKAWLTTNAAGSGPFKITRWEQNNIFQFTADPNYWRGWEEPHVAAYVHQVMSESSTKRIALQQGKAQMGNWLSPDDETLLEKDPSVVVPKEASITTYTIKMNSKVGPTADVNVRRAISYAFDYQGMIDAMSGFATDLAGPLAPSLPGAKADLKGYETNLDQAKAELAKSAQYAKGFDIEFMYVTGLDEERKTGLIMLDALSKINIKVKVTPVEWANAVAMFSKPETSPAMFPIYSGSDFPDPDNYLWQSFHSSMAGTWTGADQYANPKVDQLLEQARATTDQKERWDLYGQVQQMVVDEAVEVFCFTKIEGYPYRKEIENYKYCPVMGSQPWWYEIAMKG